MRNVSFILTFCNFLAAAFNFQLICASCSIIHTNLWSSVSDRLMECCWRLIKITSALKQFAPGQAQKARESAMMSVNCHFYCRPLAESDETDDHFTRAGAVVFCRDEFGCGTNSGRMSRTSLAGCGCAALRGARSRAWNMAGAAVKHRPIPLWYAAATIKETRPAVLFAN